MDAIRRMMRATPRGTAAIISAAGLVAAASLWILGPFREASKVRQHAPEAAESTAGRVPSLRDTRFRDMAAASGLPRIQGVQPLQAPINGGGGRGVSDVSRVETEAYRRTARTIPSEVETAVQRNLRRFFMVIVLASLLAILGTLLFAWLTRRRAKQLAAGRSIQEMEATDLRLQQALDTIRTSEEMFSVALNAIGEAIVATDSEGRVTFLNAHAETLTGWIRSEALALKVDEVFCAIEAEPARPTAFPAMAVLELGMMRALAKDSVLISRDGRKHPIAGSCAPIRNLAGEVVGAVLAFRDVTVERAAHQAMYDSTALIQTILNTVVDGIITLRASDTIIETINPAAERMFGYAPGELIGQTFGQLIPELHCGQNNGLLECCSASIKELAGGLGHEVEGRRKDGSVLPLEIAISEMRLAGQSYFTGIFRDMTARKLAEEALLKGGALQNAIFNSANFSSIATDSTGVIQIFNVGAERMLGYLATEVVNKITPADISDSREVIARAKSLSLELETTITPGFEALVFKASRGIEDIYELTYIRKDGSRFPAIVSVTALRDDTGAIIGYLLIGTDNTARKLVEAEQNRLEQRLRDSQFYARSLFESNVDALMTTDPSGFITDINKQMEELTGCTRDELIGAPFKSHFTDPDRAEAGIQMVLAEKKITNYELTSRSRDGRETVVSFNATTFFDRDRNLQGVFGAARDVTEAKRLDLMLQEKNIELEGARAAAEAANLAKSEFLSSMSHELRSPLNAILGFAQLMESDSQPPTSGQQESLSQILLAGWHLLRLIDQILDLAKVESGGLPLSHEPVSMAEVMFECQSMIEHQAQLRGIEVTFPPFDEPCFVRADQTRVTQVVINLLTNAIKYNAEQGKVDVSYSRPSPGRIRVSIRDTGAGLDAEQLGQLFQAFNRLGREAGGEEGTGIGLVVAKRLVELMGGVIGVESTVEVGSEFWFELLAADEPQLCLSEGELEAVQPRVARGSGVHTLLYVEDNAANLKLVEQIISRYQDLRLLAAPTGELGVKMARESQPDLILMDINLPDITGFEALRALRSDPATAHILVIALSANAMPLEIERGRRAGFYRYLTKPIMISEFMAALDAALAFAQHSPRNTDPAGSWP